MTDIFVTQSFRQVTVKKKSFLLENKVNIPGTLKFASWGTHDAREIDIGLTTDQGDLSNYLNSTEFDLLSFTAERTVGNEFWVNLHDPLSS